MFVKDKKISNNNQTSIYRLSQAFYQNNKRRNQLMIGAIALTIMSVFCIGTVMKGRIDAEYKMDVRHNGNTATSSLTFPIKKQVQQIRELTYIQEVGAVNYFSDVFYKDIACAAGVYVTQETFNVFYEPAYTHIEGTFPKKSTDIMLARRALEEAGISDGKVGTELWFSVTANGKIQKQKFTLSGIFTEYVHPIEGPPLAFFAQAFVQNFSDQPDKASFLLIRQNDFLTGTEVKDRLYRDVDTITDEQLFESNDSVNYNVVMRTVGGYDIALTGILLILLCVFLLNYNVMNIAIKREIRQFGFLKTLGATNRQIRKIIYYQTAKMLVYGSIIGTGIGSMIIFMLLPRLLANYYLEHYGISSQIITFEPLIFVVSILLAGLLSFISVVHPAHKAGKISPIQSVYYQSDDTSMYKMNKKSHSSLGAFARRNLWRNKRTTLFSLLSLFVGLMVALSSLVIVSGLDYSNNFDAFPDFRLEGFIDPEVNQDKQLYFPITHQDVGYLSMLSGVTSSEVLYGNIVRLEPADLTWQSVFAGDFTLRDSKTGKLDPAILADTKENFNSTIMILDKEYLTKLADFVKEQQLPIDMEAVIAGDAVVSTDGTNFSKKILAASYQVIGETVQIKDLDDHQLPSLKFAGYLDINEAGFPELPIHYRYKLPAPNLYVSQAGFEKLAISAEPLVLELNVEAEKEPFIRKQFEHFLTAKEQQLKPSERDSKQAYGTINSANKEAALDEIRTMRIVMYTLSFLLVMLGLFNYFNTLASSLFSRKLELTVFESVGMTRKQLRKLLCYEGIYFSGILITMIVFLGSGFLLLVYQIIHSRLGYAKFVFPGIEMAIICCLLLAICIILPLKLYHQIETETIVERLRVGDEN